jgi:RluA family pseudouridine synthase
MSPRDHAPRRPSANSANFKKAPRGARPQGDPEARGKPPRGPARDSARRADRNDERPARHEKRGQTEPRTEKPFARRAEGGKSRRTSRGASRGASSFGGSSGGFGSGKNYNALTRAEKAKKAKMNKGALWVPSANAREVRVEVGMDLAHFLVHHSKGKLSVRAARRQLENGCCRINGQVETYGSRQLKYGEIVEFFIADDNEHTFEAKRLLLDDVGVIAYDKPAYLPVTPTDAIKSWSLLDILTPELGELFPVHRLDADTSGIVLFARSQEIATKLEKLFKDHAVEKTYHAIVRGHPREVGQYRSYLVKKKSQPGFEQWQSGRGPDAREAITHWEVEQRLGHYGSLVRVEPKTGRYHQIRIHFSEMDFPLYGDHLYGDRRDPIHVTRHLLHASRIHLPHPVGGSAIDVRSKLPKDFNDAMMQLRKM